MVTRVDRDRRIAGFASNHMEELAELAASFAAQRGGLLPLLHAVQARIGHVPDEAVPIIAHAHNLSRAEVHGVLTFYS